MLICYGRVPCFLERQNIYLKVTTNNANTLLLTVGHDIYVVCALHIALPHSSLRRSYTRSCANLDM